jgi:hypothetical protein
MSSIQQKLVDSELIIQTQFKPQVMKDPQIPQNSSQPDKIFIVDSLNCNPKSKPPTD